MFPCQGTQNVKYLSVFYQESICVRFYTSPTGICSSLVCTDQSLQPNYFVLFKRIVLVQYLLNAALPIWRFGPFYKEKCCFYFGLMPTLRS